MTRKIAERSRRAPGDGRRDYKVAVRFTASERAKLEAAAEAEGLVLAAYVGIAALATADPEEEEAAGHASRAELRALIGAAEQLRRIGHLLNQVVRTMHTLGQVRPEVEYITARVWARVEVLDEAVLAVAGQLRVKRRRRR